MNKLSWRTPIISTAALLLALHSLSATQPAPYSYQPADRGQISAGGDTKILPAKFLREYDPITVLFDRDMHPEGSGPLDKPEGIMSIKPMHPGEYRGLETAQAIHDHGRQGIAATGDALNAALIHHPGQRQPRS
jgi:hypothetical protein